MSERTEPSLPRFLDELVHLCAHLKKALPGESVPCFAHLRIEPAGAAGASRARDLLLGWRTVTSPEVTVLNWQTAPLAEVFFSCREGEEYELSVGGRELCGTVRARSLLTFQAGELVAVHTAGASFARRRRSELLTTNTDENAMAPAAPFMASAGWVRPHAVTTVPLTPAMASAHACVVLAEQKADEATGWMPRYAFERRAGPMATTA